MAMLWTEATNVLGRSSSAQALAVEYRAGSSEAAQAAVAPAVPAVIAGLRQRAENSAGIVGLLSSLRDFDRSELDSPSLLSPRSRRSSLGPDLARRIFGADHSAVVAAVADEARVQLTTADGIVSSAAWVVCALVAERAGSGLDRHTLLGLLQAEQADAEANGWGAWISGLGLRAEPSLAARQPVAASANSSDPRRDASVTGPLPTSGPGRYPPPLRGDRRPTSPTYRPSYTDTGPAVPTRPGPGSYPPPQRGPGGGAGRPPVERQPLRPTPPPVRPQAEPRRAPSADSALDDLRFDSYFNDDAPGRDGRLPLERGDGGSGGRRRLPLLLAAVGIILIGAIAYVLFYDRIVGGGDDADQATETASAADDPSVTSTSYLAADVATTAPGQVMTELLELTVPMTDIFDGSDRSGLAELTLDPTTGDICYNVTTDGVGGPYDAHIHSGEINIKGGIVVDFGDFENPQTGCLAARPVDVQAIMANLDQFYVEMHDFDDVHAVRGQLSAGLAPEDEALLDSSTSTEEALFDPESGGATAVIEDGRVVLDGAVADQATVDLLLGQFADLTDAGTEVVNNLTIDPAAPLPTGTIEVDDAIFFAIGSFELQESNSSILSDLATVFKARPDWTVLIVGHTDNTGTDVQNLELSKNRANSVFDALVELGVSSDQLRTEGAGSTDPVASNDTDEGRSQNRRIEFEVTAATQ